MLPPSVPPPLERFRADCADKDQIRWPVSRCVAPIRAAFKLATVTHRPDKECEMTAADGEPLRAAPATTPARGNACSTPRRSPSALWRHSRRRLRPDCGVQQIDRGPQFAVTSSAIGCRTRRAKTSGTTLGSIASTITVAVSPGSVCTTTLHGSSSLHLPFFSQMLRTAPTLGPIWDHTLCAMVNDLHIERLTLPNRGHPTSLTWGNALPLRSGGQVIAGSNPVSPTDGDGP
jgi:hypothetical protein